VRLKDKVLLICGAGPGMGRTVAVHAVREGARVALMARTTSTLENTTALVAKEGAAALCVPADATDPAAVRTAVDQVVERFGRLDILVHSLLPPHLLKRVLALDDTDLPEWRRSVEISIFGALVMARAAARPMVEAGRGTMVFVTATSAFQGYPGVSAHAAGKAGIHSLAQCLASELGPLGIRVNSVAVGVIGGQTRELPGELDAQVRADIEYAVDASRGALRRNPGEAEVAEAVIFLASDASSGTSGQILTVDGGRYFR
jgi:NAD(P)-dependent dehydrogenase (short-subunit alcohol dehydrogenase family)